MAATSGVGIPANNNSNVNRATTSDNTDKTESKNENRYKFEGTMAFSNPNIKFATVDSSFRIGSFRFGAGVVGLHDPSQTVKNNVPYIYDSNTNSYLVTGKNGTIYALKQNGSTYDAYNYNVVSGAVGAKVSGPVDLASATENKTDQVFLFFVSAMYEQYLNDSKTHSVGIGPRLSTSGYGPGVQKVYLNMLNTFGPGTRVLKDLVGNPNTKPGSVSGAVEGYYATKDELSAARFFVGATMFEGSSKPNPFFTFMLNTQFKIGNTHLNLFGMYEFARLTGSKDFLDIYSTQSQNTAGSSYALTGAGVEFDTGKIKDVGRFMLRYAAYIREGTADSNPASLNATYSNTTAAHVGELKYSPIDALTLSAFYMYSSSVTEPQAYPTVRSSQHTAGLGLSYLYQYDPNWSVTAFVRGYFTAENNRSPILTVNSGSVTDVSYDSAKFIIGVTARAGNAGSDVSGSRELLASARREIVSELVKAIPKKGEEPDENNVYQRLNVELRDSDLSQKANLLSLVQHQTQTKTLSKMMKDLFPKSPKDAATFKTDLKNIVKDLNVLNAQIEELSAEMAQRKGIDADEAKKAIVAYIGKVYGINYNELMVAAREIEKTKV
jgi:hypothetical protein